MIMKKKLLIFHRIVAPYRVDFFNELFNAFDTKICLYQTNLLNQKFDYSEIEKKLLYKPEYLLGRYYISGGKLKKGIWKTINSFSPDVILTSECGQDLIEAILYKKFVDRNCKVVTMTDDSYDMVVNDNHFSKVHKFASKLLFPHVDGLINVEQRVADYYLEKKINAFYFPIITSDSKQRYKYNTVLPISNLLFEKYSLYSKKILLFVGRLVELKNLQRVIPSFKRIEDENIVFIIVGDGNYRGYLENLADGDSRIIFTGRLEGDELLAWYNLADYFILPSTKEPFGAVTNEALLAGCKVIVSKLAGSQGLVKDGNNGYVIDPFDEEQIFDTLNICFDNIENGKSDFSAIRDSLMNHTFEFYMSRLINWISSI